MKRLFRLFLLMAISTSAFAQEVNKTNNDDPEEFRPKHSVSLTIGHEHAFNGRDESGKKKTLILPFWGVDYNFQFSRHFTIGLHTDMIVETFKVEKNLDGGSSEVVERTDPIAPAIMSFYKPNEHWSFGLGAGGEFAKEEDFALLRTAIEYGAEIRNGWEVFGSLQYDFRVKAYDTFTIGLGIGKQIGGKKRSK